MLNEKKSGTTHISNMEHKYEIVTIICHHKIFLVLKSRNIFSVRTLEPLQAGANVYIPANEVF